MVMERVDTLQDAQADTHVWAGPYNLRVGSEMCPKCGVRPRRRPGESCHPCFRKYQNAWYANNKDRIRDHNRRRAYERRHGYIPEDGPCDICGKVGPRVVDHDHACHAGERSCPKCRRGEICKQCNSALGLMQDSAEVLRRAADYLEEWKRSF